MSVRGRRRRAGPGAEAGYTYLVLMVMLAVMALGAALTLEVVQTRSSREAEARLLSIGHEFERAFATYYRLAPAGQSPYPRRLEDLLRDPRYPGVRRHLRRIYADPLDAQRAWGLVAAPGGGIMGVYSLAPGKPMREDPGPLSMPVVPTGGLTDSTSFPVPLSPQLPTLTSGLPNRLPNGLPTGPSTAPTSATGTAAPRIAITSYAQWRFGYDPQAELARRQNALAPPSSTSPSPSPPPTTPGR